MPIQVSQSKIFGYILEKEKKKKPAKFFLSNCLFQHFFIIYLFICFACCRSQFNNAISKLSEFISLSLSLSTEMSPEQQKQLIEIRKRKQELLLEIQVCAIEFSLIKFL